ncbi:MAG: hypothetical protein ACK521_01700 [bacterium]
MDSDGSGKKRNTMMQSGDSKSSSNQSMSAGRKISGGIMKSFKSIFMKNEKVDSPKQRIHSEGS